MSSALKAKGAKASNSVVSTAPSSLGTRDESDLFLSIQDVIKLLCEHASARLNRYSTDRRTTKSLGLTTLCKAAESSGIKLSYAAIQAIMSGKSKRVPRIASLKPVAKLLGVWTIKHPVTKNRLEFTAEELRELYLASSEGGREARIIKSITDLLTGQDASILEQIRAHVAGLLESNYFTEQWRQFDTEGESEMGDSDSRAALEKLLNASAEAWLATHLQMVTLSDQAYQGIFETQDYVSSLLEEAGVDMLKDLGEEKGQQEIDRLIDGFDLLKKNRLPAKTTVKEIILLLALYAKKPYEEKIESPVTQFLGWLDRAKPSV